VKADKQERQVLVRVLGEPKRRRRLLAVIRKNCDQIHAEMKEFKPTEWEALEGHPEEWMSEHELKNLEMSQVKELPKSMGDELIPVDVTKVLDETDVPGVRYRSEAHMSQTPPQTITGRASTRERPLKLFISYAAQLNSCTRSGGAAFAFITQRMTRGTTWPWRTNFAPSITLNDYRQRHDSPRHVCRSGSASSWR
jgi:hypothetical protein